MMTPESTRMQRLQALAGSYSGDWTEDRDGAPFTELAEGRYAAIIDREHNRSGRDWWISTFATIGEALAGLAEQALEGDIAIGVIDLDTGAAHGVHIAPPVVSDIGGEGAPAVPWEDAPALASIEPGDGATSRTGARVGA
jgi:hypothetical protein